MTNNTGKVLKLGLKEQNMREITTWVRKMAREIIHGRMVRIITVYGKIIRLMDLEHIFGKTVVNTMATGKIMICMGWEFTSMPTVFVMTVNMKTTRKKVLGNTIGLMAENMKVTGTKANSMVLELMWILKNKVLSVDSGNMGRE